MRLVTANVNGIRAALRRGGVAWLADQAPDVIALQEVRADDDTFQHVLAHSGLSEWSTAHAPSDQPGRAGVALVSREKPVDVRIGFGADDEFAETGRWIEVDLDHAALGSVTVVSCYVPKGLAESPKHEFKMRFLSAMTHRLNELRDSGQHAVVAGDFNVAHHEVDIKNWKGNLKRAGFLPEERAVLTHWLASGWVDLGREHGGSGPGPYTWWSWRGKAFDNDAGWRIDYVLATPELANAVRTVTVGRAPSYAERWSDHAAVTADFDPEKIQG